MTEALIEPPADRENGDSLADWAEALVLLEGRRSITRAELRRRLADRGGDFEVGLLLDAVRARARRAPAYPFDVDEKQLRRTGTDSALYEFLLWASFPQSPVRLKHDYAEIDRFFDRVVLRALSRYLGEQSVGVRFGTPASDGRPKGFADALKWLGDLMDIESTGTLPPNSNKNDAGVDVIVWLPFLDGRSDYLVAIAQCTLRTNWEDKAAELLAAAELWGGKWIALGRQPSTFLAVPFTYSSEAARFAELRGLVNVILDRMRLCGLANDLDPADKPQVIAWSKKMRDQIMQPAPVPVSGSPKALKA